VPGTLAGEPGTDKRIDRFRFVYSFVRRLLLALILFVAAGRAHRANAAPPPPKAISIVTTPYWTAELFTPARALVVRDLDGDGRLEIVALTDDGRLPAWDALGNAITPPATAPDPMPTALTGRYSFTLSTAGDITGRSMDIITATVIAREGDREVARMTRQMLQPYGSKVSSFKVWPGLDADSILVGDDEGLTWWRIGAQSLRFFTGGRPTFAWMGRLTPDGPPVAVVLVVKQIQVFGALPDVVREGVLWRVPRPAAETLTSLDEDGPHALDKTGRLWWAFGAGETVYLIRDDGQVTPIRAPGPVTHIKPADVNLDGAGEVIVSLDDGSLVALTTDTRILWQLAAGPNITHLDVMDVQGKLQILVLDESPALRLVANDGQEIARLELPFPAVRYLVADINDDSQPEIVVPTNGENGAAIIVTDAHGKELWQRKQTGADWASLLRVGGQVKALVSDNGEEGLIAYSPQGSLLWHYTAQGAVYYDAVDPPGDGTGGVVLSNQIKGPLVGLDSNGREIWKFEPRLNTSMNTNWVITTTNGQRALFESWYTLAAGNNVDQPFVTRLDPTTGQEIWTIRPPQTVYATQAADIDGDGRLEVWAFTYPGTYRLDAETGAYLQVSLAEWSNHWFQVTRLDGSSTGQVVFYDANGVEAHGMLALQPPWAGMIRAQVGQGGQTDLTLSQMLSPGKGASLSVTLAISLPVAGRWVNTNLEGREEKSGRLFWATSAFGPWDAGQKRAYELRMADGAYTLTHSGTLEIPSYPLPSVVRSEGGRYSYRLPLNTARAVTVTLEVYRPGSQAWYPQTTEVIAPGLSGQWDLSPFGVWDSGQEGRARFVLDDGLEQNVFAQISGPQLEKQTAPQVEGTASGYLFSGQVRDPHALTLTVEMLDPVVGWSVWRNGGWIKTAAAVVPAGGGAFATEVHSFYDAFDVGQPAKYRIWADDGIKNTVWIERDLPPIAGLPLWGYLIGLVLVMGVTGTGTVALLRQREARRLEYEMRVARGIQESLMPDAVPSVTGLDIAGGSTPALEVGGDFFGYYWRENGELGVAVGDVSGKGLPAALLMAVSVGALSAEANRSDEPEAVLDHIDTVLDYYTRRNRLNTALCYVVLGRADSDSNSFQVCAVNAGAIPPLLRRADGRVEWLEASGLPLGIPNADGAIRTPVRVQIQRGDVLVLTSDGVVEAMNAHRQVFGFDRFERAVATSRPERGASSVRAEILSGMHTFGAGVRPHDDVTLVVIRVV